MTVSWASPSWALAWANYWRRCCWRYVPAFPPLRDLIVTHLTLTEGLVYLFSSVPGDEG
jgi:hypothetical protein